MKTLFHSIIILVIVLPGLFSAQSCKKSQGCMDKTATNFDPTADQGCSTCCTYNEASATTSGSVLFYSTGEGMPTVTLSNGLTITAALSTGCTDTRYTNHVSIQKGNYTYTATNNAGMSWKGNLTITAGECTSTGLTSSNTSADTGNGTVEFVTDNTGLGSITVTMDNIAAGTINPYIYSASYAGPGFGVSAISGTHSYSAYSANGQKWTGTAEVTSGKITTVSLSRTNMSAIPAGYSQIVYYSTTQTDYKVNFSNTNIGAGITNSTGSTDACSQKWVVSTVVPFGTYSWTATSSSGKYFSGSVVANSNGCIAVEIK